ncbi:MAG: dihydroneopterin aldolase [Sulfurovum sp. FS06-10]|jgi:dihydroneopterin aldolase|nr:MAG: dihydroneopterin aldolase [Sulfurovum sp. FS06-10]
MTIHIEALTLNAIIGILDFERIHKQKIIVDVMFDYLYTHNNFINYADVIHLIEEDIKIKKYELLEEALENISNQLFNNYPQITQLTLKITKPNIIPHAKVALSLTLYR